MVSATGVKRLARLGMVDNAPGMSALDMNTAEDMIVRNTREVVPGMIICGMEVSPNQSCLVMARTPSLHAPPLNRNFGFKLLGLTHTHASTANMQLR